MDIAGTERTNAGRVQLIMSEQPEHRRNHLKAAAVLIAGGLSIAACSLAATQPRPNPETPAATRSVDLLTGKSWQLPNVTEQKGSLLVSPSGMAITKQSGAYGYDNPPVNLFGEHLQPGGDFGLQYRFEKQTGTARAYIYGEPPLIEDEFRAEIASLKLSLTNDKLSVSFSDQRLGLDGSSRDYRLNPAASHDVSLQFRGGVVSVSVDGRSQSVEIPVGNSFHKNIWLGLDAKDGTYSLTRLQATSGQAATIKSATPDISMPPISGFAEKMSQKRPGFLFGAAIAPGPLVSDAGYRELLGNFNAVSIENAAKWQFIHPAKDQYNFADMDSLVSAAASAGRTIHGHSLIFGEANPKWLQDLAGDPAALQEAAKDHITTIMKRYAGKVTSWDVVNEPLADYDTAPGQMGLRKNSWYQTLGPTYVDTMLRTAHEADPTAQLWINDFGLESDDSRFENMYQLAKGLVERGVPLTGIGFQAHIDSTDTIQGDTMIDTSKLHERIRRLQDIGLKSRFSEVDISSPGEYRVPARIIETCLSEPSCSGVTSWGLTDKYSSGATIDSRGIVSFGEGLLWDRNLQPTQAVAEIRHLLR